MIISQGIILSCTCVQFLVQVDHCCWDPSKMSHLTKGPKNSGISFQIIKISLVYNLQFKSTVQKLKNLNRQSYTNLKLWKGKSVMHILIDNFYTSNNPCSCTYKLPFLNPQVPIAQQALKFFTQHNFYYIPMLKHALI